MHELFTQVLAKRDLSRAGDLFSVADSVIVDDLTEVLTEITAIASLPDYAHNSNDQSVVEICVTRVTSCIRETESAERHCGALVALLESCLHHSLQPGNRDQDPPHAKIAADVIASVFLNYSKRTVMEVALPVAVKFLHKGNKELSRNLARYLSLAAIEHASLLSPHVQPVLDSIISGNYPLCRVLAQIYQVSPEPLGNHAMALVALLPHCDVQEQLHLLHLFALIAKNKPTLLEASVPQLCEYLVPATTSAATMQVLLSLAEQRPTLLAEHVSSIKAAANRNPSTVCLAAKIIAAVGKLSKDKAQEALNFVLEHLPKADRGSQTTLLREATLLCSSYPVLFTDKMLSSVRQRNSNNNNGQQTRSPPSANQVNHTSTGITIVKLTGTPTHTSQTQTTLTQSISGNQTNPNHPGPSGYTRRAKLGDSRSTGRLHSSSNTHRSMTRLNIAGGSVGGLHSMSRLSSSQQINLTNSGIGQIQPSGGSHGALLTNTNSGHYFGSNASQTTNMITTPVYVHHTTTTGTQQASSTSGPASTNWTNSAGNLFVNQITPVPVPPLSNSVVVTGHNKWGIPHTVPPNKVQSGGVTVTTSTPPPRVPPRPTSNVTVGVNCGYPSDKTFNSGPVSVSLNNSNPVSISVPAAVTTRRNNNTTITILNSNSAANQRMSVFEPFPMRDTVQHFCEKHLDKIKAYMENMSSRIPPPAKCTIEERRAKKLAKLHFTCQARGEHCLYSRTFFTMRTRNPRIWIHLMFIALQARSENALSSRDASVSSLKHCWDMLKCENKTFVTLVTSAFPCAKDQEILLNELRQSGFFDVFELSNTTSPTHSLMSNSEPVLQWGCFLCNHPERAMGFLRGNTQPVIEGQLKEKKGRWRLFRRWRTRYFTLSGAHLSCKGSSGGESIDINQIRSVKVSRGARNIPKAFEIFTGDQTLILKPKDGKNAEEWVQCLSIVVAHSQALDVVPIQAKSNSLPVRGSGSRTAV